MTTICGKCQLVRPEATPAPEWQCPGCGMAYVKAGEAPLAGRGQAGAAHVMRSDAARGAAPRLPWGKWFAVAAMVWGAWLGYQHHERRTDGAGGSQLASLATRLGAPPTPEQLTTLAAGIQPGDILMYTAAWCPNCRQAKGWMDQYGFKYDSCDIDRGAGCMQQLQALGSDGVPYLIVKGHHMKDGFDSQELIAALRAK